MSGFFTAIYITIMSFLGLHAQEEVIINDTATVLEVPTGNPGQSAPPTAVAACEDMSQKDICSFELSGNSYEGICTPSGDELACTPGFPDEIDIKDDELLML